MADASGLFDLSGKVALVTGGSRGLGRAMVLAFARAGADVIIASRKLATCEATAAEVRQATGRRALPVACHVGHWGQVEALAETAYKEFGRVDVLVNNAGMSPLYDRIENVTEDLWDKVLDVNLKGPFRLTAMVGARMAAGAGGSIIMVSSTSAIRPTANVIPYAAAKAAVNAMTEGFARAFGPDRARQLHHAGPVPHRHLEGLGPRGLPRARQDHDGARPRRRARGGRRRRALLRLGRLELHHRRGARRFTEGAPDDASGPSAGRGGPPELAPVRPGEELDWAALETWLRPRLAEVLPAARGPARGPPVPERLGQPHLPAPARRRTSWCCAALRSARSRPAPTT